MVDTVLTIEVCSIFLPLNVPRLHYSKRLLHVLTGKRPSVWSYLWAMSNIGTINSLYRRSATGGGGGGEDWVTVG